MSERKKRESATKNKEAEPGARLFSALKKAKRASEVKSLFFSAVGIEDFDGRGDNDVYGDVLFVFKKEKKITPQKLASLTAQALYTLRRIRYEETAPLPAYLCGVCREEAFLCETQPFAHFYGKRAEKEYDWDRTPASPCPVLIRDLLSSSALFSVRVYSLQNEEDERAFRAALSCACGTQLSLFPKQKKPITEENFEKVYEYWASLFAPYLNEKRGDKKLAEYFLADALRGGKHNKNGRVDFLLESGSFRCVVGCKDKENLRSIDGDKKTAVELIAELLASALQKFHQCLC